MPFILRKADTSSSIPVAKDERDISVAAGDIVFVSLEKAGQDVSKIKLFICVGRF